MGRYKPTLLLAIAVLSAVNAFHDLVPRGNELVYAYKGVISAGTNIPKKYVSELFVNGQLHLQAEGHGVVAQLSDLTYKLYNGERYYGYEEYLNEIPMSKEMEDLVNPFKMSYHSNGQLKSISMEKSEKMYARNMHRAIASTLQLDCKKIHFHSNKSHAFTTEEKNLYGECTTEYYVRTEDKVVIVKKMHDMKTTKPIYSQLWSNLNLDYCEANYEEPVFHDSQQEYRIEKLDKEYVAKYIETTGSFQFHPFMAKSEDQYVSVNVALSLVDVKPITTTRTRKSEQTEYDLYYRMDHTNNDAGFIDLTNGRQVIDAEAQTPIIIENLKQMGQFLHDPINEKDTSVSSMMSILVHFDLAALEKLYAKLCDKISEHEKVQLQIFHQILPQIGSYAAVILTKKLIYEKKVEDSEALDMLSTLPAFLSAPTEKMLIDMEDMLTWDGKIDEDVRKSAILCFASMVHKTYVAQEASTGEYDHSRGKTDENEHLNYNINGHKLYSYFTERFSYFKKKSNYFEKFVKKMAEKMESPDLSTQELYVSAIFNSKLPYMVEHLPAFANGGKEVNTMTRISALWALAHVSVGNSDYIYELCWPIFANPTEQMQMRIVAYYILMESHPTLTRLLNIKQQIEEERDCELYNFHYTYVKSMIRTSDPCHYLSRLNLAQVFQNILPPTRPGLSYYDQIDYVNTRYRYGEDVNIAVATTKTSRLFKLEHNVQTFNRRFNKYGIIFRIAGMDETITDTAHLNLNTTTGLFNYDQILKLIQSVPNMKNVEISVQYYVNNQITRCLVYTEKNMNKLLDLFKFFINTDYSEVKKYVQVSIDKHTVLPFPTEMGIPVVLQSVMPTINRFNINTKKEVTDNGIVVHFDNQYYMSQQHRYGLRFYNTFANTWQGIDKFHKFELQVPLFADLTVNMQQGTVKLSFKRHEKQYKDEITLKVDANRQLVVKGGDYQLLEKSCPKCSSIVFATRETERTSNEIKNKIELENIGYDVEVNYVSDRYGSATVFDEWRKIFQSTDKKNFDTAWDYLKLVSYDWRYYVTNQPAPATTKLSVTMTPSPEHKSAQIDTSLRFKETLTQEKDQFLPGIKYNVHGSMALKNKDKMVHTWDVHYTMDLNCGHNLRHTKVEITSAVPTKKEFKISYNGLREWTYTGVFGNATITVVDPDDEIDDSYEILMVGKPLDEQTSPHHAYAACLPFADTSEADYYSRKCLAAHTSIRKYTYNIKATRCPKGAILVFDSVKRFFKKYYSNSHEEKDILKNEATITLTYPTDDDEMNIVVDTSHESDYFMGIPIINDLGLEPENTHDSSLYMYMHENNLMQVCTANVHQIQPLSCDKKTVVANDLGNEWTLFVGDVESNCQHGVFLKKIKDTKYIALKSVHGDRSVEMYPYGDHYEKIKILVDGKEVDSPLDYNTDNWFSYLYREQDHVVVMTTLHFYLHMEYTGEYFAIEIPKVNGVEFYGKCFV